MVTAEQITAEHEAAWLILRQGGYSIRQIAGEVGVSVGRVHGGLQRAMHRGGLRSTALAELRRPVLAYGASCKPLKLLTCADVHPCRYCRGLGVYPSLACCLMCEGSGVGPMPVDTVCVCAVGHCTGAFAELRLARRSAIPAIEPETRIAKLKKALDGGELDGDLAVRVRARIAQLEAVVETWAGTPTRYKPDPKLKGGK